MANTITYSTTTLTLSDDLQWVDELAWKQVDQRVTYSITGAAIVEAAARQAGRPITLRGGADYAWLPRATLLTLRSWAGVPGRTFALVLRDAAPRTVAFNHEAGAIEAAPVVDYADPVDGDFYAATLRFIEL